MDFTSSPSIDLRFQLHKNIFLELMLSKLTLHVFVCDSENFIEKLLGNALLGKSHFGYIREWFWNSSRKNFGLECKDAHHPNAS